jgi:hypothetical protein
VVGLAVNASQPKLAISDEIESVQVPDRELAVVIGHELLDRYANEPFAEMSIGVIIMPPQEVESDFRHYKVSTDACKQARMLGIRGRVEAQIAYMARHAAPLTHPKANWRFNEFIMGIEGKTVTWLGVLDPQTARLKRR